jgi:hypothetical protein
MRYRKAMMKTRMVLVVVAITAAAVTLPRVAFAHADSLAYDFGDPSKNIACELRLYPDGGNSAQCDIDKHGWVGPKSGPGPCPQTEGYILMLREAGAPEMSCLDGSVLPTIYAVLDDGQTRTAGAITCDSQPSGMTCSNTATGHFFRLSRDSYQVG